MNEVKERKVSVRIQPADETALAFVWAFVQRQSGAGVRVSEGDAVRWALHTTMAALAPDAGASENE